jgi:hypothetical protein
MNPRILLATSALAGTLTAAIPASAAIVEIEGMFDVDQTVFVTGANLFNIDPETGQPFDFETAEYNRILDEEVPFLFSNFEESGDGEVYASGQLNGKWRFDDSGIQGFDLSAIAPNDDGTQVGPTANVASEFQVIDGGMVIDGGSAPVSRVLVGNSISGAGLGIDGTIDVLAVAARFEGEPNPQGEFSDATLLMVGNSNWFDNNTVFDLATALESDDFETAGMIYFEETFSGLNIEDSLYGMELSGFASTLDLRGLGNNTGEEADPLLPNEVGESGEEGEGTQFTFDLASIDVDQGQLLFIDPEIAVGYTYVITDGTINEIHAPSLADVPDGDGSYTVTINGVEFTLTPDAPLILASPISEFTLTGIDPALMLDPANAVAFKIGLRFDTVGQNLGVVQTALTINTDDPVSPVPLPASALLLLAGLGGLGIAGRRKARLS